MEPCVKLESSISFLTAYFFFYSLLYIWREGEGGDRESRPFAHRYRAVLRSGLTNRSLRGQIGRLD